MSAKSKRLKQESMRVEAWDEIEQPTRLTPEERRGIEDDLPEIAVLRRRTSALAARYPELIPVEVIFDNLGRRLARRREEGS